MRLRALLVLVGIAAACTTEKRPAAIPPADTAAAPAQVKPAVDTSVGSPLWVTKQFYAARNFDLNRYATPAFRKELGKRGALGERLRSTVKVAVRPLRLGRDSAVTATIMTEPAPALAIDWYTFLARSDSTWQIITVRRLEFSPVFHMLANSNRKGRIVGAPESAVASMQLALATDSALKAYLVKHRPTLDSIAGEFLAASPARAAIDVMDTAVVAKRITHRPRADVYAKEHALLENAKMSSVFRGDKFPGCIFVRINGEGRRQAGYLRADSPCSPPKPEPSTFIYVEHVVGPWYVYKTL